MIFLLGVTCVLETFLENSSTFLNLGFWDILKGRPSEIIRSAIEILIRVSLEVIIFLELPSIPKTSETFEKIIELLSDDILDTEENPDTTYELASFDEVILLELRWMVDSMAADDLFYILVMYALIFSE